MPHKLTSEQQEKVKKGEAFFSWLTMMTHPYTFMMYKGKGRGAIASLFFLGLWGVLPYALGYVFQTYVGLSSAALLMSTPLCLIMVFSRF